MTEWLVYLWKKYNPFDQAQYVHAMMEPFKEFREELQSIRRDTNITIALLENQLAEKELVLQQFIDILPDMVWMKDMAGRYLYANIAIKEQLLLCPNPIGMDDVQLAAMAKACFGDDNHTFGEKCANSDTVTIENNHPSKFLESGKVKGKMMYLEVYKTPVRSSDGVLIGVAGSGRVLTEYIEAVKDIEAHNCIDQCCIQVQNLANIFKKYEFGECT